MKTRDGGRPASFFRALGENNAVSWSRGGPKITVRVPVEIDLEIEVDLQDDDRLKIERSW